MDNYVKQQYVDVIINDIKTTLIDYSSSHDNDYDKNNTLILEDVCGYNMKLRYYILYVAVRGVPRLNINFMLCDIIPNLESNNIIKLNPSIKYLLEKRFMFKIDIPVTRLGDITNKDSGNYIIDLLKKKIINECLIKYLKEFRGKPRRDHINVSYTDETMNSYVYYYKGWDMFFESFNFKNNFKENKIHDTIDKMLKFIDDNTYTLEEMELQDEKRRTRKWYQFWI